MSEDLPPSIRSIREQLKELNVPSRGILLTFTSGMSADGGAGESVLVVSRAKILLFSALPLDPPELVRSIDWAAVARVRTLRSILATLCFRFENERDETLLQFQVPGLQRESWDDLQEQMKKVFGTKFEPVTEDGMGFCIGAVAAPGPIEFTGFGFSRDLSAASGETLFSPLLEDRTNISITDVSMDASSGYAFSLPGVEIGPSPGRAVESKPPPAGRTSELPAGAPPSRGAEDAPAREGGDQEPVKCGKCGRKNNPTYTYCLGCGTLLRKKRGGRPPMLSGVVHSTSLTVEDENSLKGCLNQVFYIVGAVVALLALQSLTGC